MPVPILTAVDYPGRMDIEKLIDQLLTTDYGGVEIKRRALLRMLQDQELIQQALSKLAPMPGSLEARAMGCRCPILDNQDREGTGTYVITSQCPIHWRKGMGPGGDPADALVNQLGTALMDLRRGNFPDQTAINALIDVQLEAIASYFNDQKASPKQSGGKLKDTEPAAVDQARRDDLNALLLMSKKPHQEH